LNLRIFRMVDEKQLRELHIRLRNADLVKTA
jgi:hypothetical protein